MKKRHRRQEIVKEDGTILVSAKKLCESIPYNEQYIRRLAFSQELPGERIGGQWYFNPGLVKKRLGLIQLEPAHTTKKALLNDPLADF